MKLLDCLVLVIHTLYILQSLGFYAKELLYIALRNTRFYIVRLASIVDFFWSELIALVYRL